MKIGILGGGLTGLALGHMLAKNGVDFEILEKEHETGGLMRSIVEKGYTFDYGGSHIIFSKDKEVLDFMVSLIGSNIVKNTRNTKILYDGRYVKYPFENGLSDLSPQENFECVLSFVQNLIRKERGELSKPENLKQWFYYTFGSGITEKYLLPYNEKIWKYDTEKTSTEWVERIPNPPVDDIIKSSIGIVTEGYTHQLHFYYPRMGGIEAMIKSLEKGIDKRISRGFEVNEIERIGKKWKVKGSGTEREYNRIISTMPIHYLLDSINAPKEIMETASELRYNSLITIMLGIDKKKINDFSWLYIPDKSVMTHRISFPSNYSDMNAPKGKSSILAEITCNFGDEIWKMKDEDIVEKTIEDLCSLGIIKESDVCFSKVRKLRYAYVINDIKYSKNISAVRKYVENEGISLVGRFSEFKYLNMDGCIRSVIDFMQREFPQNQ